MQDYLKTLLAHIKISGKRYDTTKVKKAYELAFEAHKGQKRETGDEYITHPVAVASILTEMGMDTDCIIAALLHDVVEDTEKSLQDIEKQFGRDVALLVDGVTKLNKIPYTTKEEQQAENVRKMLLAMSEDIRVIIIKLADRLHNMRTLYACPPQKQRNKSKETMEIFAPIAHRLGMRATKEELEDLSLKYLDPIAYHEIEEHLLINKEQRETFLTQIKDNITRRLKKTRVSVHIEGRVKSIYGIYRKVYIHNRSFDEIYDIYAVRIITETLTECYNILGIIHDIYTPIPGRFKDYISTPKPNMYQSLHTTVVGKDAIPFEVQIRTWQMHYTAEYGIAAHWKYKAGITGKDSLEQRLSWVRQLLEAQKESEDVEDIVRTIKSDLAVEEVFVFTPKGDVKCLPMGSTVIDFGYAIHTAVGNRMIGAKVNGRIVPIDYIVKTGEIIEIMTSSSPSHGPSRDWLRIVKTSEARNKIRQWFKKERRDENILEGKIELEREFKRNNIVLPSDQAESFVSAVAKRLRISTVDDFYAAIGYGGIVMSKIMPRIKEEYGKTVKLSEQPVLTYTTNTKHVKGGVIVEGLDNCLTKFARCCNPVPGDDIVGFVTRGFGVSIHKKDCPNIKNAQQDAAQKERFVHVRWAGEVDESFDSALLITAVDRDALLADVTTALSSMHVPVHNLNARTLKDGNCAISITVAINSLEHLHVITNRLDKIGGVLSVERMIS